MIVEAIDALLKELYHLKASDLHITATKRIHYRHLKAITPVPDNYNFIFKNSEILDWVLYALEKNNKHLSDETITKFTTGKIDLDFAYELVGNHANVRFRVHAYSSEGNLNIAFRFINHEIPTTERLRLPAFYNNITNMAQGLILVTGATGSGKSTTIASLIEQINATQSTHIVTLEDPIEYKFIEKKSLIHQREIGVDISSMKDGVKSLFREDPDVILIGEIRDGEEMINALTLSSSGHLVFATLHTSGVIHTIGRILSMLSGEDEDMVRSLLQDNLKCIINQSLYKAKGKGIIPLLEHLFIDQNTYRIFGNEMKNHQIKQILTSTANSDKSKMMFKWQSILNYHNNNEIDYEEARQLIEMYDVDNLKQFEAQRKRN